MLAHEAHVHEGRVSYRQHAGHTRHPIPPALVAVAVAVGAIVFGIEAASGGGGAGSPAAAPTPTVAAAPSTTAPAADVVAEPAIDTEGCTLDVRSVGVGDEGDAAECVQRALTAVGYYAGPIDGIYSAEVEAAASKFQAYNGLYVDGIVGHNTATELGIWPGDESFIVRTPAPPPGAMDLMGYELSSVASAGSDAPPLPEGADVRSGKRIVYYRGGQRVWAIDDDERIVRSYLVTGSQYNNETPGVYSVYSKSEVATGWNFEADLPYMVRYLKTDRGNIGFHEIPIHKADGSRYQTEAELGTRGSGGCQRQAPLDALFMWNFADIGTTVIVI